MKVRAIELGFYGTKRRRVGDEFELTEARHFSKKWMEKVDPDQEPVRRGRKPKEADQGE